MIKVKFFASLRELVQKENALIEPRNGLTLEQIWFLTTKEKTIPNNILCAINLEYASLESIASDNDEVAFFPPVTGG